MAYYSGTAASLTALRDALLTHAQADGWVLTGDVLSKVGVYFQIGLTATNVTCLGCESNALLNPAPGSVMIGRVWYRSLSELREMSFPCNYEVFGFAQELYLVVNYDTDSYQWLAFGKSTIPFEAGKGGWFAASIGGAIPAQYYGPVGLSISGPDSMGISSVDWGTSTFMPFAAAYPEYSTTARPFANSYVNSNLDSMGWYPGITKMFHSTRGLSQLLWTQPAAWNAEAALLPIIALHTRTSYYTSLVADLENARQLRIDNLAPGAILNLGADRWKVFPWYRKDASARNGSTASGIHHTGTFGWAVRYEGP